MPNLTILDKNSKIIRVFWEDYVRGHNVKIVPENISFDELHSLLYVNEQNLRFEIKKVEYFLEVLKRDINKIQIQYLKDLPEFANRDGTGYSTFPTDCVLRFNPPSCQNAVGIIFRQVNEGLELRHILLHSEQDAKIFQDRQNLVRFLTLHLMELGTQITLCERISWILEDKDLELGGIR